MRTTKQPPTIYRWFFGYHVFDVARARELAANKPILNLTTVSIAALLEDGSPDLDIARHCDPRGVAILARVPIGGGLERYILIDGYETAKRCYDLLRPLRLRVLSRNEAHECRLSESIGDWLHEGNGCPM